MIDLRSDTVTQPTAEMREAMFNAPVGDDVFSEDPSINALEEKAAALFGKEAGIFCPSGTMTNQIAIRLHTQPGDEVICHEEAHVYQYEGGGISVNSGSQVKLIRGDRGRIHPDQIEPAINPDDVHKARTRLVSLEDTSNRGGGAIYDPKNIIEIAAVARKHGLAMHLDGARVFNALVENGIDPEKYARSFDTISICLSKGLGAPVGSVLVGSREQITKARRIRKVLGGGMRQAGYLAAAGIYALDHHVDRLKEDHRRAKALGNALSELSWVDQVIPVETNIVVAQITSNHDARVILDKLHREGLSGILFGPDLIRFVTHLHFNDELLDRATQLLKNTSI